MLAYLPHQLPKWGRKIDGRIATESMGEYERIMQKLRAA